jgi:large repetitive protein
MSRRFDEDLSRWERGEISLTDLAARHPDQDVFGLASLYLRLATAGREPTPDPEDGWDAVRVGLLEPSPRRVHPGRRWRARPVVAAAALVILTTGIALAVEPVRRGVTSFLREAAGVVAGSGFVEPLSELFAPLRADPLRALGYEDHVVEWLPSVTGRDSATCVIVGVPAHGRVHISPDCSAGSYHPAPNFHGGDSFTYAAIDGDRLSGPATVEVVLEPINDAPTAVDDHTTTSEDTVVPVGVLDNDDDVDLTALGPSGTTPTEAGPGSARTLTPVAVQGAKGRVLVTPDGLVYRPPPDFNGTDEFRYTIEDVHGASDSAAVRVKVLPVNDPPVAEDVSASGDEDSTIDWQPAATDVDGDALTCSIVDPPAHGKATVRSDCTGGTFVPGKDYHGDDVVVLTVSDGAASTTAVAMLRVAAVNDPPLAGDVLASGDEDSTIDWQPAATDVDGDALTCSIVDPPAHGQATVRGDCTGGTFVPGKDYHGGDVFTYAVSDGAAKPPKPASVKVTIGPVNDPPVAGLDVVTTTQGVAVTIAVFSNDVDPDGDTLSISSIGPPGAGSVTLNADGTLTYLPWADVTGSDRFVYTISDPTGATAVGIVAVTVVSPPPPAAPSIQTLLRPRPQAGWGTGGEGRVHESEASPTER